MSKYKAITTYLYGAVLIAASWAIVNFITLGFWILFILYVPIFFATRIYDEEIDFFISRPQKHTRLRMFHYILTIIYSLSALIAQIVVQILAINKNEEASLRNVDRPFTTTVTATFLVAAISIISLLLYKRKELPDAAIKSALADTNYHKLMDDLQEKRRTGSDEYGEGMKLNEMIKDHKSKFLLTVQVAFIVLAILICTRCTILTLPFQVVFVAFILTFAFSKLRTMRKVYPYVQVVLDIFCVGELLTHFVLKIPLVVSKVSPEVIRELGIVELKNGYAVTSFVFTIIFYFLACIMRNLCYDTDRIKEKIHELKIAGIIVFIAS